MEVWLYCVAGFYLLQMHCSPVSTRDTMYKLLPEQEHRPLCPGQAAALRYISKDPFIPTRLSKALIPGANNNALEAQRCTPRPCLRM